MNYSETSYGGLLVEEIDVDDDVATIDAIGGSELVDSESVGGGDEDDEQEEDDPMGGEDDDDAETMGDDN
ncbi:MAG TPA: hypothetical protein VMF33_07860 [Acidimicrobiales bacterium]|nr:hypothetical protein [Acidimicrobiales bacterium]